jgi:poly(3-hydroxybutyrate) depolymerase
MKKGLAVILTLGLVFSMCACGGNETSTDTAVEKNTEVVTEAVSEDTESDITEDTDEGSEDTTEVATERVIHDIASVTDAGNGKYTCTYDDVEHDFILCAPEETAGAPLIVLLHGYGKSAESMKSETKFDVEANAAGYGVLYVSGSCSPYVTPKLLGWNSGIKGHGIEGYDDVGFLIALANYMKQEYSFAEDRIYACGFSNGAVMMHRLAMENDGTYSGFISVAGKMAESVWENKNETNDVSFFQITGGKDDFVPKRGDENAEPSTSPAIEDVMDYWVTTSGLSLSETVELENGELKKYSADGKKNQVWDLFVKDGTHSWASDTNAWILEFIESLK